jgi:hypothetical protein
MASKMFSFSGTLKIIGVNPYLEIPQEILESIFELAKKDKANSCLWKDKPTGISTNSGKI